MANQDGVENIVAQLRQTPKGQLKYDTQDWNEIFRDTTSSPVIHISPFVVRNNSRLASPSYENSLEKREPNVGIINIISYYFI